MLSPLEGVGRNPVNLGFWLIGGFSCSLLCRICLWELDRWWRNHININIIPFFFRAKFIVLFFFFAHLFPISWVVRIYFVPFFWGGGGVGGGGGGLGVY